MKKIYLLLLILPIFCFSQQNFWSKTDNSRISDSDLIDRNSTPTKASFYQLDFQNLKTVLSNSVSRLSNQESSIIVQFPNASGEMDNYKIYEASIMEPELAERHPEIQSYVGINLTNPGTTIRFSTTIFGFHGMIMSIGKTFYIDPYTDDLNTYTFYAKQDLYSDTERLACQITDQMTTRDSNFESNASNYRNANDGLLRTFRLALASTQEYSNFHINAAGQQSGTDAQKKAAVLAAMNVSMTRVNGIYERDMSLSMNIIANNEDIIFLTENDGYSNNDGFAMLTQNQNIIDSTIGAANYDMGHVFSTGGGGVASLGGVCFSNTKARAVTGLGSPVGDVFDVDFVAHEMGHHLGANHSYNGGDGNCGGQRNPGTAVEPGSGNTIMGYAGICASDNVQPNSDANFHAISIDEMFSQLNNCPLGVTANPNLNIAPIANAGSDFTIPFGTAFTLTGMGSDPDGGTVSFSWEQVDAGSTTDKPNTTSTTDPQFKSYPPVNEPTRTFPRLQDVLDNNLTPQWEVIPNVARTMDFALTVRDNQSPNGGQTNRDDMTVTVTGTGPFEITSQDSPVVFNENESIDVVWSLGGTRGNGINTNSVNILLSTDGGQNFDFTLAANTNNDGSETVTLPSGVTSGDCRLKIEPVDNIYFAINKSFFAIGNYTIVNNETCTDYNFNINQNIPVSGTTYTGFGLPINDSVTITDVDITVNTTHGNNGDVFTAVISPEQASGFQELSNGSCPGTANTNFTYDDEAPVINCSNFSSGGSGQPAETLSVYDGQNSNGQWTFLITDISGTTPGTLDTVTITICSGSVEAVLSNNDFQLDNYALFPNPNNGEFTLQFNSNSGKDINVDVYDISGKLVYKNTYDATSRFDKQIKLNNASTGIYIMKVNDGEKTVTQKLVIE